MTDDEMAAMQAHVDYWRKPLEEGKGFRVAAAADGDTEGSSVNLRH